MGCRPVWDTATGRVTGIEVLPTAAMGRPRVDVTFRISGLFRDLFPAQIALIDAAVRAVAARDEPAEDNPLAAAPNAPRIFGTAPGAYGAGVEQMLGTATREAMGAAYLDAASHAYGGAEGEGGRPTPSPNASPRRTCWSMPAMIPAAICWKAMPISPSSAASPRRRKSSAGCRTWWCSTPPIRCGRARGRSARRWRASCAAGPIRAISPG